MKKKALVTLVLVSLLMSSLGVQPALAQISDVPRDHWAYHAVVTLVNKGYLAVYEDGTFQGNRPVDRYTLAVTVARILDDIEAGRVQGTVDDLALIEELTNELRNELVAWYAQRDALTEKLSSTEQMLVVTDDRLNRVVASHTELQAEVAAIKAELLEQLRQEAQQLGMATAEQEATIGAQQALISRHGELLNEQSQTLTAHELQLNEHAAQLKEYQARLDELVNALVEIENALLTQDADIASLQNWAGEKSAVLAALQQQDSRLSETTQALSSRLDELNQATDSRISELQSSVAAMDQSAASTLAQLQETQAKVAALSERAVELEKDLQNLAVLIQRETQRRNELSAELEAVRAEMSSLETQIGISEEQLAGLRSQLSEEVRLEMNAALIREQRLERQIAELQEEFATYKQTSEAQVKSSKTMAMVAIAVGAIGVVVGLISRGVN